MYYYSEITEQTHCCANCAYFYQHYAKSQIWATHAIDRFIPVNGGHCVFPRIKYRQPHEVCDQFKPKNEKDE